MGDQDKVQAMADANWTPAVTYWRERCEKAEAHVKALVADLLEERENNAAEFADRTEAQRKCREMMARVATLENTGAELMAANLRAQAVIAAERAGADALAALARGHLKALMEVMGVRTLNEGELGHDWFAALSAHDARRKGGV